MGLIRFLFGLAVVGGLLYCAATVPLGDKTFFQHARAIWGAEETQELVEGVKEKAEPVIGKVKRGVETGVREAARDEAHDAVDRAAGDGGDGGGDDARGRE